MGDGQETSRTKKSFSAAVAALADIRKLEAKDRLPQRLSPGKNRKLHHYRSITQWDWLSPQVEMIEIVGRKSYGTL